MDREQAFAEMAAALKVVRAGLQFPGQDPLWARLPKRTWRCVERVVRHLARSEALVYGRFGSEDELRVEVVSLFDRDAPDLASFDHLVAALTAASTREWVVASPLANLLPPDRLVALSADVVLVPTPDGERVLAGEVKRQLRDALAGTVDVGSRRHRDCDGALFDSRHTATLVSRETGLRRACAKRALTKAQFTLAVWTLLSPPTDEVFMPIWPTATEWLPQPHVYFEQRTAPLGVPGDPSPGMTVDYPPDESALYRPPEPPLRDAPIRALEAVVTKRPARALLSASWSLYLAARLPTDLQWLDRLGLMMQAREALCEPPDRASGTTHERWLTVCERLGLVREMRRRGFRPCDLNAVSDRGWELRNLVVHSADAALVALGFPGDRVRAVRKGPDIPGAELAPLYVREGIEPVFAAVTVAAAALWRAMLASDFNEDRWEELLAASPGTTGESGDL